MSRLPPLRLRPELYAKVWGGERLADLDAERHGPPGPVGEAWLAGPDSRIADGPFAGQSLQAVLLAEPAALLGSSWPQATPPTFPLLVKLLDTQAWLSVQVHPDDDYAQLHEGQPFGKAEAWAVLDAAPGAEIIHGLRQAVDAPTLRQAVERGTLDPLLRRVPVHAGDVVVNPPGTIHALGPGIFLYEVQQAADLTYRLYDWGRDAAEAGRSLHIDKALAVARRSVEPAPATPPAMAIAGGGERNLLCHEPDFVALRWRLHGRHDFDTRDAACHVVTVLAGRGELTAEGEVIVLRQWDTIVVPAACGAYALDSGSGELVLIIAAPLVDAAADRVLEGLGVHG
jgi:mannose-6-phosphate isomerase